MKRRASRRAPITPAEHKLAVFDALEALAAALAAAEKALPKSDAYGDLGQLSRDIAALTAASSVKERDITTLSVLRDGVAAQLERLREQHRLLAGEA